MAISPRVIGPLVTIGSGPQGKGIEATIWPDFGATQERHAFLLKDKPVHFDGLARGCWSGPLIALAAYLDEPQLQRLLQLARQYKGYP